MDSYQLFTSLFMFLCSGLGVIFSLAFIVVVAIDRRHRKMIVFIALNTAFAGFIITIIYVSQSIYQMISDTPDILCPFRGFLLNASSGLFFHTLCIQTLYRLFVTVYAHKRYLQSSRTIGLIVIIQWLISMTFEIPILLIGRIKYQANGRICQMSIDDVFGFMYTATFIYLAPLPIVILIYIVILKYMKRSLILAGVRQENIVQKRQKRELRFVKRILVIVSVLFITGFPYVAFFLMVNIGHQLLPFYGDRISFMFISFGQASAMLLNLIYTDAVRKALFTILTKRFPCLRRGQIMDVAMISMPRQAYTTTLPQN